MEFCQCFPRYDPGQHHSGFAQDAFQWVNTEAVFHQCREADRNSLSFFLADPADRRPWVVVLILPWSPGTRNTGSYGSPCPGLAALEYGIASHRPQLSIMRTLSTMAGRMRCLYFSKKPHHAPSLRNSSLRRVGRRIILSLLLLTD